MSITTVGTIGIDSIYTPFGQAEEILGGSAAYFALAAHHYQPVNIVAVVGADLPPDALAPLRRPGIDTAGIARANGPNFRWGGKYHLDLNTRETLFTELGVLADFQPHLPESYRAPGIVFLANLQPTVQEEVLRQTPNAHLRALDTMNFWISNTRADLARVLGQVDIVIMAEEEVRQFAGVANLRAAARKVFEVGPQILVIKLGSYGALLLDRDGTYFATHAFPLEDVVDPTGAGDTFAGGFLGALAARLAAGHTLTATDYKRALLHGNIMGAFACEDFGLTRLTQIGPDDIRQRYAQLISYTHIETGHLTELPA